MTVKPPPPQAPTSSSSSPRSGGRTPAVGDTQVLDLQDVELLMATQSEKLEHAQSLPPPLPAEVRAPHVPSQPVRLSQPPPLSQAPAPRSNAFYALALLVFLVLGIGGGLLVAVKLTKSPAAQVQASGAKAQATVITIPVVEVADDVDGGPSAPK